jgi:hypothetical protein
MILIPAFALFLVLVGIFIIIKPGFFIGLLTQYIDSLPLYLGAIVIRLLLGGLLIYFSSLSRFPVTMLVIGIIAILAALIFTAIGRQRFEHLMSWIIKFARPYARAGGVLSICFGVFLLYAFL